MNSEQISHFWQRKVVYTRSLNCYNDSFDRTRVAVNYNGMSVADRYVGCARGLSYDAARDVYTPTTQRQLAPMFEAIFEDAPTSNADDAVLDYLTDWNEILWQVYPDYAPTGSGNLLGAAVGIDQAFIMQMLIPAFEARGWSRRAAAANDNEIGAWTERPFCFSGWEMAA